MKKRYELRPAFRFMAGHWFEYSQIMDTMTNKYVDGYGEEYESVGSVENIEKGKSRKLNWTIRYVQEWCDNLNYYDDLYFNEIMDYVGE